MRNNHINRYIVECKVCSKNSSAKSAIDINRYIVECKGIFILATNCAGFNINRYIVECKFQSINKYCRKVILRV